MIVAFLDANAPTHTVAVYPEWKSGDPSIGGVYLEMEAFEGPTEFLQKLRSARIVTKRSGLQGRIARLFPPRQPRCRWFDGRGKISRTHQPSQLGGDEVAFRRELCELENRS